MTTIGLINPGQMGASVGAAATHSGATVLWASEGRSDATRERAERGGLTDAGTLGQLVKDAEIILSVCPPSEATTVVSTVIRHGFKGLYLEGNAIAPGRTHEINTMLTDAGAEMVDGGIIGGPAWKKEAGTVLHVSGPSASTIVDLFAGSPLHLNIVSEDIGAASTLKMAFAAYTKGSTALLSAILALAEIAGVREHLAHQWGETFSTETARRVSANTAKAWRFVGEMEEIAATFEGAGLPGGFHQAAAEVFRRQAEFKDQPTPKLDAVLTAMNKDN